MSFTFNVDIVSDLHKDAYGFRPGEYFWNQWDLMDDVGRQITWDNLIADLKAETAREELAEKRAIVEFNELIAKTLAIGAKDQETAIRWIMEGSENANGDWEYLCYEYGLPYGFFKSLVNQ